MACREQPIHFANATLGTERHICAFFNSSDEEYRVLLPFIQEGFERGEKAFHIVDPRLMDDHLHRMRDAGIDCETASRTGQLVVKRWQEAYLRDGHFDQDRMLALVEEVLSAATMEGYPLLRLIAHMDWALEDFPESMIWWNTKHERTSFCRSINTLSYACMTWPSLVLASQWIF